ncbi:DNA polymerase III subunit gamma/tau [Ferrimonas lipolytica]|uniref:DNA-directed DNA polymerase n=1 Tax=Ferrimonas lipolytica TaxID=2724191 RepID=A0A6H1UA36_9GAMM|nr:DNA polymerase III subunit gamma/tau [Ferrimonas lipolytica]QIZ75894.1 DNA polymerase III subunit gamma/tau [Ferrimonas lipolytica]
MSYQVLARKWRPATFDQVVGQEHVLKALTHALQHNRLHHAYLFTGTRGVGKTSIARLLAKGLNCEQGVTATPCGSCNNCVEISQGRFVDLLEIDAASRTKVDDTREILDNVQYQPVRGRFKVYLIDEVHMLSRHSFNALLKTLEEPPEHVKFLLATTDPQKLPVTVLSRCLQFNLKSVIPQRISAHLAKVLDAELVGYEPAALDLLAQAADGSVRDGMSLTDQAIAHGAGALQLAQVQAMLGTIDSRYSLQLMNSLCQGEPALMQQTLDEIDQFAPDYDELLRQMAALLHQVALAQFNLQPHSALADADNVQQLAGSLDREQVQLWYQMLTQGRIDLNVAPDPRSGFEMVMLRALAFAPAITVEPMQARQVAAPVVHAVPVQPAVEAANSATAPLSAAVSVPVAAKPKLPPIASEPTPAAPATTPTSATAPSVAVNAAEIAANTAAEEVVETSLASEQAQIEQQAAALTNVAAEPQTAAMPSPPPPPQSTVPDEQAMDAEQALLMAQASAQMDYPDGVQMDDYQPDYLPDYDTGMTSAPPQQLQQQQPSRDNSVTAVAAEPELGSSDPMAVINQVLADEKKQRQHFASISSDGDEPGKDEAAASTAAPRVLQRPPVKTNTVDEAVSTDPESLPPWHIDNDPRLANANGVVEAAELSPAEAVVEPLLPIGQRPLPQQEAEVTAVAEPVEAPAEPAQPLTVPAAAEDRELDMQWYQAIGQLGIGARPRQLAINSVLERDGEQVVLNLRSEQRHLNSDTVVEPLQQSLQTLWNQTVQLRIEVKDLMQRETPLEIRRRRQRERLEQAKQDLYADPVVQWLQSELDANLLDDSVAY